MRMKKLILIVTAVCLSSGNLLKAQWATPSNTAVANLSSMDVYAAIPVNDCGWGGGFNLLSTPINIGHINYKTPIQARIGGEFYLAMLNKKRLGIVPLADPQNGNAKVNLYDNILGLNAMARFSLPYSSKITPYLDIFGGLRGFSANMNITPEIHLEGQEETTSKNLSSTYHFNYGATFGVLVSINDWVKFNAGMMYTYSEKTAEVADIKRTYVVGGNIIGEKMFTRNGVFVAKVGLTFLIDWNECSSSGSSSRSSPCNSFGSGISSGGGRSNSVNFNFKPTK